MGIQNTFIHSFRKKIRFLLPLLMLVKKGFRHIYFSVVTPSYNGHELVFTFRQYNWYQRELAKLGQNAKCEMACAKKTGNKVIPVNVS